MKRFLAILMAIAMLSVFAGCDEPAPSGGNNGGAEEGFCFTLENVVLTPGAAYPADQLPAPLSVYTVPSCALDGTDNVYQFQTVEVTAFKDSSGEFIYSIFLTDANTPTAEGLYLGDSLDQVTTLYGSDYQRNGTEIRYQKGNTLLVILLQNDFVFSIEYRMITN